MLPQALRSGPRAAALATLAVFAAAPLPAQTPAAAPLVVTVAPVTLTPGGKAEAKVTLEILRGVRIIAPGSEGKFLQPAQLAFNAADGVFVEPPAWPDPKVWHAEPDDPPIKVFEGKIQFTVTVHAGPKVQAQELMLQGRLPEGGDTRGAYAGHRDRSAGGGAATEGEGESEGDGRYSTVTDLARLRG
jgi:hypothetical protein